MSELAELDTAVAAALHCPGAAVCVWKSFWESPQRERAVRTDEAGRWQRTFDRLVTRVEQLEADLRAADAEIERLRSEAKARRPAPSTPAIGRRDR